MTKLFPNAISAKGADLAIQTSLALTILLIHNTYRLRQTCKYDKPALSGTTDRESGIIGLSICTTTQVQRAIIHMLGSFDPASTMLKYARQVELCFPFIAMPTLENSFPHS